MTLLDGRVFDNSQITFNRGNYHFITDDGEDVTDQVLRKDKMTYSGFDPEVENQRVYNQHYSATHAGAPAPVVENKSVAELWAEYTVGDIRKLGAAAVQPVTNAATNVLTLAIIGGIAWLFLTHKPR